GVPSVSFNALIGHRSCAPEDYRKDLRTLRQGPVPVSCVFPAGSDSRLLETRLQAMRLSPYRADLPAHRPVRLGSSRPFPGMLLSPVTFQITGQPSDPKTPPPVHARSAGYIAVRLVAHADHSVMARWWRLQVRPPGSSAAPTIRGSGLRSGRSSCSRGLSTVRLCAGPLFEALAVNGELLHPRMLHCLGGPPLLLLVHGVGGGWLRPGGRGPPGRRRRPSS